MRMMKWNRLFLRDRALLGPIALLLIAGPWACEEMATATRVTSPVEQFGHEIGADYVLPNYAELAEYWERLASESDRMILEVIGETSEGRDHLMATITSPANHRNLARYREIAERMARAEGVSEAEARAMAEEGRAVIWIDGGLHASEVLGAQQLMQLVYHLVSGTDDETMRILDDVVVLVAHANPDGHDLLADWYMRIDTPEERSTGGAPVLYNKYAGHDNNRDFYMSALNESTNINRILAREWFPQIVYNHHQTGPAGTVMFAPALPRSAQPLPGSAHPHRSRPGRFRDAPADGAGREGGHDHAQRRELLDVVERRTAHHAVLQEPDRPAHGDHRQPDTDRNPLPARAPAAPTATCRSPWSPACGTSASPSTIR